MLALLVVLVTICAGVESHGTHLSNHQHRIKELKEKWSVEHVIRDIDHIKEDLSEMLNYTDEIPEHEMLFFMIRMHDFDDNGGLDGIEMRIALAHSMEHSDDFNHSPEAIERAIEDALKFDDNNDGVVDYAEFRKHRPD
ncbi:Multiple coagulation factor deficiency protein 2-like protein, partial [Stegodyphus mimosarum]